MDVLGVTEDEILLTSAKMGTGIKEILQSIVDRLRGTGTEFRSQTGVQVDHLPIDPGDGPKTGR